MGKKLQKKKFEHEPSSIYKDENDIKEQRKKEKIRNEITDKIARELEELGLPTEFSSTKGKQIKGQINVEARRMGMIRKYQSFQRRKLKEWQKTKIRGSRVKQRKNAAKVVQ